MVNNQFLPEYSISFLVLFLNWLVDLVCFLFFSCLLLLLLGFIKFFIRHCGKFFIQAMIQLESAILT